ncbi:hypothetical protein SDC9_128935 [bioreactor metagenome]|uniref:Uncharacterized protein n=1 Tax=bioreactor metagenome TaxID=1076179 RepID=A0A645CYF0_9ZZZZ
MPISPTILEEPSESEWKPSAERLVLFIILPISIFSIATRTFANSIISKTFLTLSKLLDAITSTSLFSINKILFKTTYNIYMQLFKICSQLITKYKYIIP